MKQNSKKIAVTGGIGSGKSEVCKILAEAGYSVFSCDEIYREMLTSAEYLSLLDRTFTGVVKEGKLDKNALADIVFQDKEQLKKLNALVHPLIMQKLAEKTSACALSFSEVPLLFETGMDKDFDDIIIVYRPENERIAAVCNRDNLTVERVIERIKNQIKYEKIIKEGYTVIYNDCDANALKEKVLQTVEKIIS